MQQIGVESDEQDLSAQTALTRPHASMWLWQPWYAKLWWAVIVVYWGGKLASYETDTAAELYSGSLAGLLNILLFPLTAVMILGVGFARACFARSDWELVEATHEDMFPKRSVGGLKDPYSDPLDPGSGMLHWKQFHPDS